MPPPLCVPGSFFAIAASRSTMKPPGAGFCCAAIRVSPAPSANAITMNSHCFLIMINLLFVHEHVRPDVLHPGGFRARRVKRIERIAAGDQSHARTGRAIAERPAERLAAERRAAQH